ncbi:MAG TPA: serine/threonine-protein kinase, partial [Nitrospiria bacterium]|nr:serine/threonine-protein kinase [Nitrospiria bacterium]
MEKQLFSGKYELEGEIARGGMGVIYKATHTTLNRKVAIKVLHPQYSGDSAFVKRFLREARAMARLDHQNIIRVFDVAEDQGSYYIVMEFFQGQDLRQRIIEKENFSYKEVLLIALQVADALSYAHAHGIIHRDIKPGNIMIDSNEKVKIADFGIAAATDEVSVTATGQIIGTPEYMSPEQAQGLDLDGRCDLYSLGMILYEMLTGKTAFERISRMSIIGKLLYDREEYALSFSEDVPLPVQDLVRCLLKKRPQDRIPDANTLMTRINRILEGGAENPLEETLSREDQMPVSLQEAEDDPTLNLSSTPSPAPHPELREAIGKPATRPSSRPKTDRSAQPLSQPPKPPEVKTQKSGGWIPLVAGLAGAVILA